MKKNLWFFLLMLLVLIGLSCCEKNRELPATPDIIYEKGPLRTTVTTTAVTDITQTAAKAGGKITDGYYDLLVTAGICYSKAPNPKAYMGYYILEDPDLNGEFTFNLTDLTPNTLYYVRAFANVWDGEYFVIIYGDEVTFTTNP
jgi:hypothetical protein